MERRPIGSLGIRLGRIPNVSPTLEGTVAESALEAPRSQQRYARGGLEDEVIRALARQLHWGVFARYVPICLSERWQESEETQV
jgi:hypothetical protein